jgi:hypothetical protein
MPLGQTICMRQIPPLCTDPNIVRTAAAIAKLIASHGWVSRADVELEGGEESRPPQHHK